jgi:molybdate transport system substrate-binding protein
MMVVDSWTFVRRAVLGFAIATLCAAHAIVQAQPVVAAASDLKFAMEEIAAQFAVDTGRHVKLVFGSSGNFARQIEQGAPFHLFMSADEDMVFRLADAGKTLDRGALYAIGRIVLIAPHDSVLQVDGELKDLAAALKDGRLQRLAIANPEHAPYGKRAEEALRHAGLWDAVKPRLVLGENVSQAAQFALSGSTQGGLIAYSLALAPEVGSKGRFALVPESWHQPLRQRMVMLKGADETTRAFYAYLQQTKARAIMRKFGFNLPGE